MSYNNYVLYRQETWVKLTSKVMKKIKNMGTCKSIKAKYKVRADWLHIIELKFGNFEN